MTPRVPGWNEAALAEDPAIEVLQKLGYTYVAPEVLEAERDTLRDVVLVGRLRAAIKRLNPWIIEENIAQAVRSVTNVAATSLAEANETIYVSLTYNISLRQDRGHGTQGQTVRFIDFDEPLNNEFVVTRQMRVKGTTKEIIPDAVVFVNGVPLAVLELKSPTVGDKWLHEAVEQLLRYQEARPDYRDLGAPRLFETMQLLVTACGQGAAYGTVGTPQRFFAEWKTTYPALAKEVERALGRPPRPQDVLLWGLFAPANLLDIVGNFVIYERDAKKGCTIHKLPRYPQYLAVNKAIARIKSAKVPSERGGVVWHTQGSGKSLTMLWLALKLRRDPAFRNPTIVIVTDRTDLDQQISDTFHAAGFPNPDQAGSVRELRELLSGPTGKTICTTVQKFQELTAPGDEGRRARRDEHPVLSTSTDVFLMVDEAHRTQYRSLAGNMRRALPNACFLGFTGTPIDKKDRSTLTTFGPYIDTYTIEQAVADGATVPIFYESRLPQVRLVGQTLDQVFERVFADRTDEERAAIKKKYATEDAIASAPRRVEAICLDLIDHYTKYIQPNGFKAQIVTVSREAAVVYKETLDRLNAPPSEIAISTSNDDPVHLVKWGRSKEARDAIVKRFTNEQDPLSIIVVCDMLLTGFDAPVEQVMYLDSPLKEHTLLQAIARVNRKADKKDYGLVVDYWGVSEALQEALAIFSPSDIQGAMSPKVDELPRLQARHGAAMRFFATVKDRNDLYQCAAVLEPEDVRAEFDVAFRRFAQSLDMMLPDPRALPYNDDMRWLGKVRMAAAAKLRDHSLDITDCGAKVKKLIEDAIVADGVELLVKQVSLFAADFDEKLDALRRPEAKASEMEHAIKHEIHVRLEENPAFYESLRERLEKIIEARRTMRVDAAKQLEMLQGLADELRHEARAAQDAGLSDMGFAIYGLLERDLASKARETTPEYQASRKALAALLEEAVADGAQVPEWTEKNEVQREMRRRVKQQLRAAGVVDATELEQVTAAVMDLAKVRKGR